eukprot:UN07632
MCEKTESRLTQLNTYPKRRKQVASDTFILNGANLKSYLQLFKQKARTVNDPKIISCSTENELIDFFQDLNKKWIIAWDVEFSHDERDILSKALIPKIYNIFLDNKQRVNEEKLAELC